MTGAGSANVAFSIEQSFATLPGTPTWIEPGKNIEIGNASLERSLTRARQPDDPRPAGSREGNREVALSVTFTMTDANFHDLVFADAGTALASTTMLAPTATWYLASDTLSSTQERFIQGAAVESVTWNYAQNEDVTVDLTIIGGREYGGGDGDAPATPGTITQPTNDDIVTFSSTDFQIDSATVSKLQSLSLSISGLARFRRGQQQEPVDAVTGAYDPSLTVEAILEDGTRRELAYGSSGATAPEDRVSETSGTLSFSNPNGSVADYSLSGMQVTNYDWTNLVAPDTDITDPVEFDLRDVSA
jgi:hypothetical protein